MEERLRTKPQPRSGAQARESSRSQAGPGGRAGTRFSTHRTGGWVLPGYPQDCQARASPCKGDLQSQVVEACRVALMGPPVRGRGRWGPPALLDSPAPHHTLLEVGSAPHLCSPGALSQPTRPPFLHQTGSAAPPAQVHPFQQDLHILYEPVQSPYYEPHCAHLLWHRIWQRHPHLPPGWSGKPPQGWDWVRSALQTQHPAQKCA